MRQIVLPHSCVASTISCIGAYPFAMAHIAQELPLVSITIAVNLAPFSLLFIVTEIALVLPIAVPVDNMTLAVLETIFELASINIPCQGPQTAITFHLTLSEVSFVDVSIL